MFRFQQRKIDRLLKKIKGFQSSREHNEPSASAIKKEINCYNKLCKIYSKLIGHKLYPYAHVSMLASYRAAASLHDKDATFFLGRYMLEEGNYHQQLEDDQLFSHPINQRARDNCYDQAHVYLEAATQLGDTEAMRLLGLCYIHGWGYAENKDKGFDMVVDSIDKESAWDKLPEIFAKLGLNKPELISELMQHRRR